MKITFNLRRQKTIEYPNSKNSICKEAWTQLYNAFGERMQDGELKLMDSVLQSVITDEQERQDALQNQTPS